MSLALPYNPDMLKDGFFELQTPVDLLKKLTHDFERVKSKPGDSYASFDFVVTARHLHDWASNANIGWRPAEPLQRLAFKLCGDVADGAKHFVMRNKRPMGHTVVAGGIFGKATYGESTYGKELVIALTEEEAAIYGRGTTFYGHDAITMTALAELMLTYWKTVLGE